MSFSNDKVKVYKRNGNDLFDFLAYMETCRFDYYINKQFITRNTYKYATCHIFSGILCRINGFSKQTSQKGIRVHNLKRKIRLNAPRGRCFLRMMRKGLI